MKKYFMLAIAAMALTFVSCSKSPEAQAEDYVEQMGEAVKAGDLEKITKVAQEAEKWYNNLSPEEKEKVDAFLQEKGLDLLGGATDAAKSKLEDAAEDLKDAVGGFLE